ncbi:hypothetical protein RN01_26725 [Cupriavidus sp. SHE]|nr:hypothetical protein RN01_26725 [Cupriavidus sp. SHE]
MHHHRNRHFRPHTRLQQGVANGGKTAHPHVDDERRPAADQCGPIGIAIVTRMRGNEGHTMAMLTMGQRNAKRLRSCHATADAVDDFHFDAVPAQELCFLAAATEQQWVAAFDTRHAPASLRVLKRLLVNTGLTHRTAAATLADRDDSRPRVRIAQHGLWHEIIH